MPAPCSFIDSLLPCCRVAKEDLDHDRPATFFPAGVVAVNNAADKTVVTAEPQKDTPCPIAYITLRAYTGHAACLEPIKPSVRVLRVFPAVVNPPPEPAKQAAPVPPASGLPLDAARYCSFP
ncbi:hypothetical protein [Acerihabitans arboris]|uniref:Uncharacterized protein n=1 Tax=Acerihabitans arboris TaxID=2691583 RepID=A0A845SQ02_9GAMM|nr:hypothetical protein [Acerihabitans arboris]NDL64671.1 hypothetical protein [Acerihabitans arboris]